MRLKLIVIFIALSLLFSIEGFSQFTWATIGVDGLTCSQCSKSVELSLRKLDFVQNVEMDLEQTNGKITFKPAAKVNIEKIAQAVVNAGFSVRYLHAGFAFQNTAVTKGFCFSYEGNQFQFVKTDEKILKSETTLKFLGKEFLSSQEYKKWKADLVPVCDKQKGKILFVTL